MNSTKIFNPSFFYLSLIWLSSLLLLSSGFYLIRMGFTMYSGGLIIFMGAMITIAALIVAISCMKSYRRIEISEDGLSLGRSFYSWVNITNFGAGADIREFKLMHLFKVAERRDEYSLFKLIGRDDKVTYFKLYRRVYKEYNTIVELINQNLCGS